MNDKARQLRDQWNAQVNNLIIHLMMQDCTDFVLVRDQDHRWRLEYTRPLAGGITQECVTWIPPITLTIDGEPVGTVP